MSVDAHEKNHSDSSRTVGRRHAFTVANTRDIYFPEKEIVDPSPEHLIQAGFGSPVMVTGLIDKSTNNEFGATIDNLLMERLQPYRALLGGESRKETPLSVVSDDGRYSMAGGVPTFIPHKNPGNKPWVSSCDENGQTHFEIKGYSLEKTADLTVHALRSQKLGVSAIANIKAEIVREIPPQLAFGVTIGGDGFLHGIAKSLFNLTAHTLTPQRVLGSSFDEIRAYVLDGVAALRGRPRRSDVRDLCVPNARFNALATTGGRSSLTCSFAVRGSSSDGCIYGLAVLYGHLPFSCLISDRWDGEDFAVRLAVDPHPVDPWWSLDPVPLEQMPPQPLHVFTDPRWNNADTDRAHGGISGAIQSAIILNAVLGYYNEAIEKGYSDEDAANIVIQRVFDPSPGSVSIAPEEILNLIRQRQRREESDARSPT